MRTLRWLVLSVILPAFFPQAGWADVANSWTMTERIEGVEHEIEMCVEYYLQTNAARYALGEPVDILFRISNTGPTPRVYRSGFGDFDGFGVSIQRNGTLVQNLGLSPGSSSREIVLDSGRVFETSYTWDMRDLNGNWISPGRYEVIGVFAGGNWVYVPVTIVPEPGAALFCAVGAAAFFIRQRLA